MTPSPSDVVAMSVVVGELQQQLLAWERELDSREGAIAAWEYGLAAFAHTLREVCTKCDVKHIPAEAV
jgi:hypothetical protein